VEGGIYTAVSGRWDIYSSDRKGLREGECINQVEWNMELDFKVLNMIISMYSYQGCEKCDITGPSSFLHSDA
jgi:hypothetical protein